MYWIKKKNKPLKKIVCFLSFPVLTFHYVYSSFSLYTSGPQPPGRMVFIRHSLETGP